VVRWIAFLYSEQEYYWPEYSFIQIVNSPLNILTIGWWDRMKRRKWEQFLRSGRFRRLALLPKEELEGIVADPKFFAGSDRQSRR
jgi:hypothetical protein